MCFLFGNDEGAINMEHVRVVMQRPRRATFIVLACTAIAWCIAGHDVPWVKA
jgi:hypothetical protein